MINNIKWRVVFIVCYVSMMFKKFSKCINRRLLLKCAIWFRIYLVIDFIFSCCTLPLKYNERYTTNFYFLCFYIGFLVIAFFLMGKFIKEFKKGDKNDT